MATMTAQERLRAKAEEVADALAQRRHISAVLLYGSIARGEATDESDIDLLVVGHHAGTTSAKLRRSLGLDRGSTRVSLVFHTPESLNDAFSDGSRFLVHLRQEGIPLFDREDVLRDLLSRPWTPMAIHEEIDLELGRLEAYVRPEVFSGHLLLPLAHVYTIGKAIVMALLAEGGTFEFNRARAFATFARRYPAHAGDAQLVERLEPFRAMTHRLPARLPFDPYGEGAPHELRRSVDAIRRLAEGCNL
jgi:predicted nucleotidyltransferase